MKLVLGIDVGTQGARVVVVNESGQAIAQAKQQFAGVSLPGLPPGHIEQEPDEWWKATRECLRSVVAQVASPSDIVSIAVDSTSGTVVLLGANNRPVRPALMYNDRRADAQADEINRLAEASCRKLGYRFNSSFALAKILWLAQHEPQTLAQARRIIHAADYIVGKLTGVFDVSDQSNALKTGFDLIDFVWPPFVDHLGIDPRKLPRVIRTGEEIGAVSKACSAETGLSEKTCVVAGATDGTAEQFASGVRFVGDWNTVLGTTLVLKGLTQRLLVDQEGRGVYCHLHPMGYWMPGGASNVGARALDERFPDADKLALDRAALALSPTLLSVYPLVGKGERFPFNAPQATGFVDGRPSSEPEAYTGFLEGIAFVERLGYTILEMLGADIGKRIYTTGGGATSHEWMQIRADVLNKELARVKYANAAMGSAIIAASRTLFDNIADASVQMTHLDGVVEPRCAVVEQYAEAYQRFLGACRQRGYIGASL